MFIVSGQSHGGKSFFCGTLSDLAELASDPSMLLVDAEEGANHAFAKTSPEVQKIRLMEASDYDDLLAACRT